MLRENTPALTNDEMTLLNALLQKYGRAFLMNLEKLDGFITALTCYPLDIPAYEYLSHIYDDLLTFEGDDYKDMNSLIFKHFEYVSDQLQKGLSVTPLLSMINDADQENSYCAAFWAQGFAEGISLRQECWSIFPEHESFSQHLFLILQLSHPINEGEFDHNEAIYTMKNSKIIELLPEIIKSLYIFFRRIDIKESIMMATRHRPPLQAN